MKASNFNELTRTEPTAHTNATPSRIPMGVLSKGKLIARAAENHEEQRRIMKKVLATAK